MVNILVHAASQPLDGRSGVSLSHLVLCSFSSYQEFGVNLLFLGQSLEKRDSLKEIKEAFALGICLDLEERSVTGVHTQIPGLYTAL